MFFGRKDDLEYFPHLILFLSLLVISEGDAITGVTGLHAYILLKIKNISLQKLTRSGDILVFLS